MYFARRVLRRKDNVIDVPEEGASLHLQPLRDAGNGKSSPREGLKNEPRGDVIFELKTFAGG